MLSFVRKPICLSSLRLCITAQISIIGVKGAFDDNEVTMALEDWTIANCTDFFGFAATVSWLLRESA